jgi:hypothetical protein
MKKFLLFFSMNLRATGRNIHSPYNRREEQPRTGKKN